MWGLGENDIVGVEDRDGVLYAIRKSGNDMNISAGCGRVKQIINGMGSAIIIHESGSRYRFDYKTEQTRQI
jgi:hypothetical protein